MNNAPCPTNERSRLFLAKGPCLRSVIPSLSIIKIQSCDSAEYRPGDIVVYSHGNDYVCHRLLYSRQERDRRSFYIKADYSWRADGWISEDKIMGRVSAINGKPACGLVFQSKRIAWLWTSRLVDCIGPYYLLLAPKIGYRGKSAP